ncbi:9846_t:CDS:2 [Ambispora gerdemannii]|uniref:9846_t:CDS:1 n=1 Tax=Ambispora gerdemannii TaxID=144530 RepID=A0A9N9BT06_9GLOM|nr:9846_t:CDS:2 [Ambispora gerdemannii]
MNKISCTTNNSQECKGCHRDSFKCWCCSKSYDEECSCVKFKSPCDSSKCSFCRSSPIPIILWCHPRSCSSVFQRAFLQRSQEFKCFQEPFRNDDALNMRFKIYYTQKEKDNEKVSKEENNKENKPLRVFVKDMAIFIEGQYGPNSTLSKSILLKVRHSFLIRDPSKSIKSFYRTIFQIHFQRYESLKEKEDVEKAIKLDDLRSIASSIGIKELAKFFDYVKEEFKDQTPLVVDADDLCKDPKGILGKYCELIGEVFDESMISWKPGKVEDWHSMGIWHSDLEQSTGFDKFLSDKISYTKEFKYPLFVEELIQENRKYYDYLYQALNFLKLRFYIVY